MVIGVSGRRRGSWRVRRRRRGRRANGTRGSGDEYSWSVGRGVSYDTMSRRSGYQVAMTCRSRQCDDRSTVNRTHVNWTMTKTCLGYCSNGCGCAQSCDCWIAYNFLDYLWMMVVYYWWWMRSDYFCKIRELLLEFLDFLMRFSPKRWI